jgi:hypothetical protein
MSDRCSIRITLFLAGVAPFALAGGLHGMARLPAEQT